MVFLTGMDGVCRFVLVLRLLGRTSSTWGCVWVTPAGGSSYQFTTIASKAASQDI